MDETSSYESHFPADTLRKFDFCEVRNAAAIISSTNPSEWADIVSVVGGFSLSKGDVLDSGGNKSDVAARLDEAFRIKGWREGRVDTRISLVMTISPYRKMGESKSQVIESNVENRGYKVDNFYGRIALDVEWNAKDGNLDRDLGAYRALYDAALIDAAVLVTRSQEDLRALALRLDAGSSKFKTTTTTNLHNLRPRLTRGDAGGCPVLAIAITSRAFVENQ